MDRLTQLRGEAGASRDSTLDTTASPSEAYMTANESSSKYFSLSEEDTTFDISPIKDISLASAADPEKAITGSDQLMSNLSPIPKKSDLLDSFKFGKEIEAANILSGGVDIFDDNDNSYDGDELVIDDNVEIDDKSNPDMKLTETGLPFQKGEEVLETIMDAEPTIASKDTEVVLQIDGRNVNAIDIGNGLYLYRKEGEEELAAVQIIDDDQQQPSFKFLKVRENAEGNLEVYEEIEIEVPKEVPVKEGKTVSKSASHVPIKDINIVISDQTCNKVVERKIKTPRNEMPTTSTGEPVIDPTNDFQSETKADVNMNGKMVKFNEKRKSPVIHSTPNKEGIPLTKTMVDLHLHPSRHSDKVKTIEVHTDSCKQKLVDTNTKIKDLTEDNKTSDITLIDAEKEHSNDKIKNVVKEISAKDRGSKNSPEISPDVEKKEDDNDVNKFDIAEVDSASRLKDLNSIVAQSLSTELAVSGEKEDIVKSNTEHSYTSQLIQDNDSKQENDSKKEQLDDSKKNAKINLTDQRDIKDTNRSKVGESHVTICTKNDQHISNLENRTDNVTKQEIPLKSKELQDKEEPVPIDKNCELSQTQKIEKVHKETTSINSIDSTVQMNRENVQTVRNIQTSLELQKPKKDGTTEELSDILDEKDKEVVGQLTKNDSQNQETEKDVDKEEKMESDLKEKYVNIPEEPIHKETSMEKSKSNEVISTSAEVSKKMATTKGEKDSNKNVPTDLISLPNISKEDVKIQISSEKKHDSLQTKHLFPNKLEVTNSKLRKEDGVKTEMKKDTVVSAKVEGTNIKHVLKPNKVIETTKNKTELKKELPTGSINTEKKAINNNDTAVPFGKWTEANRQDFLNKIKEAKVPTVSSNTKQLKQANDLNRRDVLKKIDSQRQSNNAMAKVQESIAGNKINVKTETKTFSSKPNTNQESKLHVKTEVSALKNKPVTITKKITKQEVVQNSQIDPPMTTSAVNKKESMQRKEINNQDLIDKTIEGIINRAIPAKPSQEDTKQIPKETIKNQKDTTTNTQLSQSRDKPRTTLDAIEMKMNELHGIPFVERPPHELPQMYNPDIQTYPKPENQKTAVVNTNKIPNLLPFPNKVQQKVVKDNIVEIDSEEEVIEHEPITGDIELNSKQHVAPTIPVKLPVTESIVTQVNTDVPKQEAIITEKDFDKFARRNSITYENRLTVNFEGKEPHNVVQTVVEKDVPAKKYSRNEILLNEAKVKASQKQQALYLSKNASKIQITSKIVPVNDDGYNKNYQSKFQIAYQSALTAKRQMESPITIIEDKPVKVVFMDANAEFVPQLNVQGQDLSPIKKIITEPDAITVSTGDSLDSVLDATDDCKSQDDTKSKTKHQRKQVLTPVETPDLELIEPVDLGIHISPKKKRRIDDNKTDKNTKSLVPKKSYLLGRTAEDVEQSTQYNPKNTLKETVNQKNIVSHKDAASAIDNLVKAAELLETQSESLNASTNTASSDNSQQNTPVKRGRGRPRKYPLPDGTTDKTKVQSPQKKPHLVDEKETKRNSGTDEDTSDSEIIRENWTMGKINEKILCPICNKLFRSENVVFKHVKHCTGPSPNRSDSDKRSTRRSRQSRESETKSQDSKSEDMDIDSEKKSVFKDTPKKRKLVSESSTDKDDIILIEDTPLKERVEKRHEYKQHEPRKTATKTKIQHRTTNLTCEFCGKTFRQLSYLVSHKLQHKKEETTQKEDDNPSVYSCEVCQKVFRKLHHLVQHRIIHNPSNIPKSTRKSSSEQSDSKITKDQDSSKQIEDQSAAFRCEPCDKSFRKLHHLVEHRETHDGKNKQKNASTTVTNAEKPTSNQTPQCDVCKKTFRKLHHLIEHKEQHHETSSEKSDDKSVKSSLSTKDIIHECSLCYMVFPNEHSLTKHSVICQRKKRQSAAKQAKQLDDNDKVENFNDNVKPQENKMETDESKLETDDNLRTEIVKQFEDKTNLQITEKKQIEDISNAPEISPAKENEVKAAESKKVSNDREIQELDKSDAAISDLIPEISAKTTENEKAEDRIIDKVLNTHKKKLSGKGKVTLIATKRHKTTNIPLANKGNELDSSDDDEVRYMLNPDFKMEETSEGKLFMKIKAKKRNSLQIERPNSKDLVKRRTSLQHPPKIPRLKPKPIETKATNSGTLLKNFVKTSKLESVPSIDSDDSDVKYSFPKNFGEKTVKSTSVPKTKDIKNMPKGRKKSLIDKRKSLTGVAKRKSLGKTVIAKHKEKPSPVKQVKRRTAEAEHRCDCGQLFNSAALLSRHTTLAHTPPRIRRRRSPPPENVTKPVIKPSPRKSSVTDKPKPTNLRKSSVKSDTSNSAKPAASSRKSTYKSEIKTPSRQSIKSSEKVESVKTGKTSVKTRRSIAHSGVPVPEKMRKLMLTEKSKK